MPTTNAPTYRVATDTPLLALLLLAAPLAGNAQVSAPAGVEVSMSGREAVLEEVVVTARKREENIDSTPIAMSAFSGADLERLNMFDIMDLQKATPGFHNESLISSPGRFDSAPTFRGVTTNTIDPTRQTASIFVDGVYVAGGRPVLAPSAIERVEIIRGPQAALFGRSTFGGAINYIQRRPSPDFDAVVNLLAATESEYRIDTTIEGPLGSPALLGRLSGVFHSKGGQFTSLADGAELGEEEDISGSASIYFTPNEQFSSILSGTWYRNEDGPATASQIGGTAYNCGPFGGTFRTICGEIPSPPPSANVASVPDGLAALLDRFGDGIVGPMKDEFGLDREAVRGSWINTLGFTGSSVTITAITGYNREEVNLLADGDNSGIERFIIPTQRKFDDFSQELRVSADALDERLHWSIGANYIDLKYTEYFNQLVMRTPTAYVNLGNYLPDARNIETRGVFGSVGAQLTTKLRMTGEFRYQVEEVTSRSAIGGTAEQTLSADFISRTPRVTLEYTPVDGALLYLSYSEGTLPGGFNPSLATLTQEQRDYILAQDPNVGVAFKEEQLDQWELGAKNQFLSGRAQTRIALFAQERTDQVFRRGYAFPDASAPGGVRIANVFTNSGSTDIWGVELDGSWLPIDALQLDAYLAYVESELVVFETADQTKLFGSPSAAGNLTPLYPRWKGGLTATYTVPLASEREFFSRLDWFYTGKRYASEANLNWASEANEVNLRFGMNAPTWTAELFVENLLEEDAPLGIDQTLDLPIGSLTQFAYVTTPRDKRQFGVRLSWRPF